MTKQQILNRLAVLEVMDANDIAATLADAGCFGWINHAGCCPLSRHISDNETEVLVWPRKVTFRIDETMEQEILPLSSNLQEFVLKFDKGKFKYLVSY